MPQHMGTSTFGRWQVFRLLGIPVSVDASWLIVLALLTLSLANVFPGLVHHYYPQSTFDLPHWVYWLMGLISAVLFFGCLLLHELGHAVVARSERMPIRGITLFLFGGVAEIGEEPRSPRSELLMALAGPAVTVVLATLLGLSTWVGYRLGWPPHVVVVLGYLTAINSLVLAFNLLPAFPLDGGRVLRSILWGATGSLRRATYWATRAGRTFGFLLMGWGVVNFFAGNWLGGIWFGLIGLFLSNAALVGYQQVLVRQALEGEPVRRFMNREPITVTPTTTLRDWVENYVYRFHRKTYPVLSDGRLEGCIDTQVVARIPRGEWDQHTVGEVMHRDLEARTISPEADALEALQRMQRSGSSRLLVTDGSRLVGMISLKDLLRFLSLKIELEAESENAPASGSADSAADRRAWVPRHLGETSNSDCRTQTSVAGNH